MKKIFATLGILAGWLLFGVGISYAAVFLVPQGGTGQGSVTSGSLIYGAGTAPFQSVATSSVTISSPLTSGGTAGYVVNGSGWTLGCQTASGSQAGCLSSADWTTFNNSADFAWPFLQDSNFSQNAQSTTTALWLKATPFSLFASSTAAFSNASTTRFTNSGSTWLTGLTGPSGLGIGSTGLVYAAASTTFSTGLTYTSATNAVTVNTSQNIATLSNLTSNGFVQTSGGTGALGVQTFPCTVAQGCTGATSFTANQLFYAGGQGGTFAQVATTTLSFSGPFSGVNALGALVGGSNSTVTYYGLATTSAISAPQVLYATSASGVASAATGTVSAGSGISLDASRFVIGGALTVTNIAPSKWATTTFNSSAIVLAGGSTVGIGTSTPRWTATISSSTRPQLALTDAGLTSDAYTFRVYGTNLWLATSTLSSQASPATSTVAALAIDSTGKVTFGNSQQTCIGLTGSSALCDGDDGGGGGSAFPFIQDSNFSQNAVSTTTAIWFKASPFSLFASSTAAFSNASTTLFTNSGATWLTGLSLGGLSVDNNGRISSGATTTAGTGLTYSGNAFNVNTSQNISTLSNLTSNGYVKTSGGTGALSVQVVPIPVTDGGTGGTSWTANQLFYAGGQGTTFSQVATGTVLAGAGISLDATRYVIGGALTVTNTSPAKWATTTIDSLAIAQAGGLTAGIGTSTPRWTLTVSSSTRPQLALTDGGATSDAYTFRTYGGNLWLATSTLSSQAAPATSTVAVFAVDTTGKVTFGNAQQTCIGLTGSSALCDGSDDGAGGSAANQTKWATTTTANNTVGAIYPNAATWVGIGTSTPRWSLQIASSSASAANFAQLALSDTNAGVGFKHWVFSSMGGNLYIGTSTDAYATSSPAAFEIRPSGKKLSVGSSTPWAGISYASTSMTYSIPAMVISTSTNGSGTLFSIFATTTVQKSVSAALSFIRDVGTRIGIGSYDQFGFGGILDHLWVPGRINTGDWLEKHCTNMYPTVASVSADTGNMPCPGWSFMIDNAGSIATQSRAVAGETYSGVVSATSPANAGNNGAGVFYAPVGASNNLKFSTSTPVMEGTIAIRPYGATTTSYYFGFSNLNSAGTSFETFPTAGCFFNASSTAQTGNWYAVSNVVAGAGSATYVNTGIASSSLINTTSGNAGDFYRLRIEADRDACRFYIQPPNSATSTMVANVTTTIASTTAMTPGVWLAHTSAGLAKAFESTYIKLWVRESLFR